MTEPELRWMLLEEAADVLGIRPKSVMNLYTHDGLLTVRRKFGDTWLFLRSEVMHRKAHPRRQFGTARAVYKGPRCTRCEYPVNEAGALCEECVREQAPPTPPERWADGTFGIVNPAYHGVGG